MYGLFSLRKKSKFQTSQQKLTSFMVQGLRTVIVSELSLHNLKAWLVLKSIHFTITSTGIKKNSKNRNQQKLILWSKRSELLNNFLVLSLIKLQQDHWRTLGPIIKNKHEYGLVVVFIELYCTGDALMILFTCKGRKSFNIWWFYSLWLACRKKKTNSPQISGSKQSRIVAF